MAVRVLGQGGLAAFPTETTYGLDACTEKLWRGFTRIQAGAAA